MSAFEPSLAESEPAVPVNSKVPVVGEDDDDGEDGKGVWVLL